ncbi:multidrug transporter subunit MdtN [Pseudoduganella sp. RAF53_2]|uniref:multidrug transporter subunit MdtN n=1 Tax=unclassified Pseudoduganella TaxID=2637179 RepID=UPI003F98484B
MNTVPASQPPAAKRRRLIVPIVAVLALIAIGYTLVAINHSPRTDDAYAQAYTIGVASQVAGRIVELKATDNAVVHKGDVLFRIDPTPYDLDVQKLKAQAITLEHQIALTQRQVDAQTHAASASAASVARAADNAAQKRSSLARLEPLLEDEFVSKEQVDLARTAANSASLELKAARFDQQRAQSSVSSVEALVAQKAELAAALAHAEFLADQTVVRAPFDGRIVDLKIAVGEFAAAGRALFTLIDTRNWYVIANFRETELGQMHIGSQANLYLMSAPDRKFKGVVESVGWGVVPDEGGSAGGLPRVPRSINWVHVAQRFPVRIRVTEPAEDLFRIGASAVAVVSSDSSQRQAK